MLITNKTDEKTTQQMTDNFFVGNHLPWYSKTLIMYIASVFFFHFIWLVQCSYNYIADCRLHISDLDECVYMQTLHSLAMAVYPYCVHFRLMHSCNVHTNKFESNKHENPQKKTPNYDSRKTSLGFYYRRKYSPTWSLLFCMKKCSRTQKQAVRLANLGPCWMFWN